MFVQSRLTTFPSHRLLIFMGSPGSTAARISLWLCLLCRIESMRRVGKQTVFTEPRSEGWQSCRPGQGEQQHWFHEVALESPWKARVGRECSNSQGHLFHRHQGWDPGPLCMLIKCTITEPHPQPTVGMGASTHIQPFKLHSFIHLFI